MDEIKFHKSRIKVISALVLLWAATLFIYKFDNEHSALYVVLGAFASLFLIRYIISSVYLTVNSEGLRFNEKLGRFIPWDSIQSVSVMKNYNWHQNNYVKTNHWYLQVKVNNFDFLNSWHIAGYNKEKIKSRGYCVFRLSMMKANPQDILRVMTPMIDKYCKTQDFFDYRVVEENRTWKY